MNSVEAREMVVEFEGVLTGVTTIVKTYLCIVYSRICSGKQLVNRIVNTCSK